jgi:hypothetical protein
MINKTLINIIETKEDLQKLTEGQKQKILCVCQDLAFEYFPEEHSDSEYVSEYNILMKQKLEELKNHLLEDNVPAQIEALLEMCDEYIEDMEVHENPASVLGFIIMYDMWLNKSPMWPAPFNPEWDEWNKLKDKKLSGKKMINKLYIIRRHDE